MTLTEMIQGTERPDVLDKDLHAEPPWILARITDIETLIELANNKPSYYTAGGIAVKITMV